MYKNLRGQHPKQQMSVGVFVAVRKHKYDEDFGYDNHFLLVKHNYGERKWSLPGGKLEQGELVPNGGRRETFEEASVVIKIKRLKGIFSLRKSFGLAILLEGQILNGKPKPDGKETSDCGFFKIAEIKPEEIYPAQLSLLMWAEKTRDRITPVYGWLSVPPTP
ncbi:MAG: hypothetical protein A3C64_01235 [Candidatus Yanofskybacteria bacterium RIFCSPHIGHO2_02_FULL_41_12]|nr:MAG: hypothetical protein A3C64_01235 [Candidatus Yanofskybacteria bacterium RIFCSPHIGHO2_02_FULL_41_12]